MPYLYMGFLMMAALLAVVVFAIAAYQKPDDSYFFSFCMVVFLSYGLRTLWVPKD